jgi:hypothetical protein
VGERKVRKYTNITSEALKTTGNSTFKQWDLTEAETFFRLTQRTMTIKKVRYLKRQKDSILVISVQDQLQLITETTMTARVLLFCTQFIEWLL